MGKTTRTPSTGSFHCSKQVLPCIHSDLMGPVSPTSIAGKKCIMTFIHDYSRYSTVYLLKTKSDTFEALALSTVDGIQHWPQTPSIEKCLGGEYSLSEFLSYLQLWAIDTEQGPAQRPTANSVANRFNFTLLGRIRTQLFQSQLPFSLWGDW